MDAPLGTAARNRPGQEELADQKESTNEGLGSPPWTQEEEQIQRNSCFPQLWSQEEKRVCKVWGKEPLTKDRMWHRTLGEGASQVEANQFSKPVLPLAVCRSTSTVGFPLESRISRAKIFCMAMAAPQEK